MKYFEKKMIEVPTKANLMKGYNNTIQNLYEVN